MKHRLLLDGRDIRAAYGVASIPANIWVNKQGIIVDAALGFDGSKELEQKTEKLLGADAS